MLEKEVRRSIENINETKKSMIQMNVDVLKMHTEVSQGQLDAIEAQLTQLQENTEMEEELKEKEIVKLTEEKEKVLAEIAKLKEDMEKENAEIEQIGSDLEVKGSKYEDTYELLAELERRSQVDEYQPESIDKILNVKALIMPTLDLSRLEASRLRFAKNYLKSNYNKLSRDLQTKLAKDKKFIYPSCFQLKAAIRDMIKSESPELEDKELDKTAKIYTAYLILHLNTIDLKKEGIYVYYLMQNIYKIESMQIDKQFEFKQRLLSVLRDKI